MEDKNHDYKVDELSAWLPKEREHKFNAIKRNIKKLSMKQNKDLGIALNET